MTKKILLGFTVLFFAAMLFLTFFAEKIHEGMLPTVTAARPERALFPYELADENGNIVEGAVEKIAVPEAMLGSGVYVLYSAEKNGTKRDFVRLVPVQTGEEANGYVEVVSGLMFSDRIVTERSGDLYDGAEVYVAKD